MTATRTTTLTVTVMDAATIYEGPESVYRYDLPGSDRECHGFGALVGGLSWC